MKILGLIPARGGSKSVPGKNIKLLGGKPLIQYTFDVAKQVKGITRLILSSDDDDIISVAKKMGLEVPFKRPKELGQDQTPTIVVIQHALQYFSTQNIYFDAVCLLQVTSPFKTTSFIRDAITKFKSANCDSLVSVSKIPDVYNPHWAFEPDSNNHLKLVTKEEKVISRRQDLPTAYHRDGVIYITKTTVLLNENSLFGNKLAYIESPMEYSVNIDSYEDWNKAEAILMKKV
ncbi:acylneuraminate cytidylyltransferase family protein [Gelidibacter salicanalis]|uniref:Acylneuraminate cytidylyltransferase family protein n=1 Tax=Gelidibacter salicanalis TaxID=291193 RepID=A0A934KTT2_9FLAO|nr:acylneuraminate cytidylyltransferase family protein [Gelidibacter salicanalis]MBJ7880572.1 acylneuraminate cytidylyltransferase family protein [Gelidibacter salicanalis]